ncbi:MAG: phycobiliprotein lyase [Cyanobacteria bacterium J06649_4]
MDIVNFFEKLAGRWFSQRTTHALSTQQSKAGKSDLEIAFLPPDTAEVQQLCETMLGSDTTTASPLCGLRVQQSSTVEGDSQTKTLTTLMVPLAPTATDDPAGSTSGQLLRSDAPQEAISTYTLEDEVLTIVSNGKEAESTERLWFINDNLRMRTGMTELANGLRIASFCSEIRLGVKPPKQD